MSGIRTHIIHPPAKHVMINSLPKSHITLRYFFFPSCVLIDPYIRWKSSGASLWSIRLPFRANPPRRGESVAATPINHPRQPKKFGRNSVLWQNGQRGYVLWNFRFINVCLDFSASRAPASSRFHRAVGFMSWASSLPRLFGEFRTLYLLRPMIKQKHKCEFYLARYFMWCASDVKNWSHSCLAFSKTRKKNMTFQKFHYGHFSKVTHSTPCALLDYLHRQFWGRQFHFKNSASGRIRTYVSSTSD